MEDMDVQMDSQSSSQKRTKESLNKTWVEKYRPSKLEEVIYQNEVVSSLQNILNDNPSNLPNLLFYGPPGTGKTSTIIALSKELFGPLYSQRVLELNASDDRGIQVVREKVKNFAQTSISSSGNVPAIKIIVLDECDSMTRDAQSALRRTMEKYSKTTRFCLICNYASKIIDPIVSRCMVFRFKPLQRELIKGSLTNIAQKEQFEISSNALDSLINICDGDLRRAITQLQTANMLSEGDKNVTQERIYEISGFIPDSEISQFIQICRSKSYEKMAAFVEDLLFKGYSGSQFLEQLQDFIAKADSLLLKDGQKSQICSQIALDDKRLLDGGDEFIQICDVGATIIRAM